MSILKEQIQQRLKEKRMSVNALEVAASLPKGTIQNIMRGKSKNPRVANIEAIAKQLGCSVSELLGHVPVEDVSNLQAGAISAAEEAKKALVKSTEWNTNLYIECVKIGAEICEKHNFKTDKETLIPHIDNIYAYSLKSGNSFVDVRFAEWEIENNLVGKE